MSQDSTAHSHLRLWVGCGSAGYHHALFSGLIDFLPADVVRRTLSANAPKCIGAGRHCCCSWTAWRLVFRHDNPLLWILRPTLEGTHTHYEVRKKCRSFRLQRFLRPSSLILYSFKCGRSAALFSQHFCSVWHRVIPVWTSTSVKYHTRVTHKVIEVFSCLMLASLPFNFIILVFSVILVFFFLNVPSLHPLQGTTGRAEDVSGEWDVGTVSGQV